MHYANTHEKKGMRIQMKVRTGCFLLAVIMFFSLLPSAAFAVEDENILQTAGNCSIRISQTSAKPGETITVSLSVENNPGIQGATLTVTWDEALILKSKAQNGAAFSALGLTAPKKLSSPYNLVWYAQDLEVEDIKDGVIATLEFEVSSQAQGGQELDISVSYISGDILDRNKQTLSPTIANGFVSVAGTEHIHSFNKMVAIAKYLAKAASCTEAATYYHSCECEEKGMSTFSYGDPLGHSFINGVCIRCHIAEAEVEEGCMIRISQIVAKPSETVIVELSIKNNPGIQGVTLTLTWDESLALTKKAQNGEAFSALGLTAPKRLESPYNLVWYAQDLETEDIKDGVIATLEFEVSPQAKDGDILNVSASYISGDIIDRDRKQVSCKMYSGNITISDVPVQAKAVRTDQTIAVDISCTVEVPSTVLYLAEYSEDGRFIGCVSKTIDMQIGENTAIFNSINTKSKYKVFVLNSSYTPLCAAPPITN